ncbi:MAG: histidine phosphatase family protein [Lewinellaceae bacterium]|nr:histidine phosphatase family protein [Lewinellaceae bacterium]
MRTLFLIRHAKSSWDNPGLRDINRPLNDRGMHDAPRMAQLLAGIGPPPDLIVSSPAKRAFTTAMFFARVFGIDEDWYRTKTGDLRSSSARYPAACQCPARQRTHGMFVRPQPDVYGSCQSLQ